MRAEQQANENDGTLEMKAEGLTMINERDPRDDQRKKLVKTSRVGINAYEWRVRQHALSPQKGWDWIESVYMVSGLLRTRSSVSHGVISQKLRLERKVRQNTLRENRAPQTRPGSRTSYADMPGTAHLGHRAVVQE